MYVIWVTLVVMILYITLHYSILLLFSPKISNNLLICSDWTKPEKMTIIQKKWKGIFLFLTTLNLA